MNAMAISLSGLDVEWQRMEVAALNLANANAARAADGSTYIPLRLVSAPVENFANILNGKMNRLTIQPKGVRVQDIQRSDNGIRQVYEPNHPHADSNGFITYPNISQAEEMILLVKSARTYEANLVALATAQQIYSSALQIGRQS